MDKYLFDHFNDYQDIAFRDGTFILHLLKEKIKPIITIFATVFTSLEKTRQERFLSWKIRDGFYCKISYKF